MSPSAQAPPGVESTVPAPPPKSTQNPNAHQNSSGINYTRPNVAPKQWPAEFVIAGIAGRFPESDTFDELAANLLSNDDLVTRDDRRWPIGLNANDASRSGKLKSLALFDNVYFCTLPVLVQHMDPGSRIILEIVYEAIADSGIAPQALRATNTGVYVGINTVANAEAIPQDDFSDVLAKNAAFWVYGSSTALLSNRISFLFDFHGPSTVIDTACSSSLVALSNALNDLRLGVCEYAVVATANICSAPYSSHIYSALGLLAKDGKCKVFDSEANGFVRSESVCAVFLTRRDLARREYATLLNARTNTDGFKTIGLFAPFWLRQRNLMIETYQEVGVTPNDIGFIEAHGTGTMVGDPQEARAISEAYCNERPDKLLVGAVKSNMGHTEGASGLCSVAKALIAFEKGIIPANLHYKSPKPEIEVLHRTIEPVVRNTPYNGDYIGVNSFGVGGVNAHVLLRRNQKTLCNDAQQICAPIPRLVTACGRTQEAVEKIFKFIKNNPEAAHREFLALLSEAMKTTAVKGSANFQFRGFQLIDNEHQEKAASEEEGVTGSSTTNAPDSRPLNYEESIVHMVKKPEELWLVFSGMGSQWSGMGATMMALETFRKSIFESRRALSDAGIELDLVALLECSVQQKTTRETNNCTDDAVNHEGNSVQTNRDECNEPSASQQQIDGPEVDFVLITAMQIALYNLISELSLPIAGIVGHSFGEIACAYADGALTADQAILTAYWRGKVVADGAQSQQLQPGRMAAVGMSLGDALERCQQHEGVYVACHNGSDSCTISGRVEPMERLIEQLQGEGVFVRQVAGGSFPYHSAEMAPVCSRYIHQLNGVISEPKKRSNKWISSSTESDNDPSNGFASAEYFVNNLRSMVRFDEAMSVVPKNALCIEIAPHSLFKSIFARCFKDLTYVGLMMRNMDSIKPFLVSVGEIYTAGFNPAIEKFYPAVQWPVSRGTPSIGSLIEWDHSEEHYVPRYPDCHNFSTASNYTITISCIDPDWRFLKDHAINGKIVFPATGMLWIVWRALATKVGQPWHRTPVRLEGVRICRPTLLTESTPVKFTVQILDKNGEFTLSEANNVVCTGKVFVAEPETALELQDELKEDWVRVPETTLDNREIYKELRIRGYDYGENFQGLKHASGDGKNGIVQWTGNWISFVDSALHISLLSLPIRTLFVPIGIEHFVCNPSVLFSAVQEAKCSPVNQQTPNSDETSNRVDLNREHLESEFCYFSDLARKSEIIAQGTEEIKQIVKVDDPAIGVEIVNFDIRQEENKLHEKKSVEFGVKFDFFNQSLVTTGIEVRGMLPVNVPRINSTKDNTLTIERFEFVPSFEDRKFDTTSQELEFYIQRCTQAIVELAKKFNVQITSQHKQIDSRLASLEPLLPVKSRSNTEYFYLQTLEDLLANDEIVTLEQLNETMSDVLTGSGGGAHQDWLFDGHLKLESFYRPIFELVADNLQGQSSVKTLEINPFEKLLGEGVEKLLKMNVIHKFELDYSAAKHANLHEDAAQTKIKFHSWPTVNEFDFLDQLPNEWDLVVLKRNSTTDALLGDDAQRQKLLASLKTGGFLVTIGRTSLTEFERDLETLFPRLTLGEKIVSELSVAEDAMVDMRLIGRRFDRLTGVEITVHRKVLSPHEYEKLVFVESVDNDTEMKNQAESEPNSGTGNVNKFQWLERVQRRMTEMERTNNFDTRLWLVTNNQCSGILGLFNCLRLETNLKIRILINHCPESISSDESEIIQRFSHLMATDLVVMHVDQSTISGSYRFISMRDSEQTLLTEYSYLSQRQRGDLSSLQWYQSEFETLRNSHLFCDVHYSALNFKDVVLASGKIAPGPESALFDCILGLEFSGRRRDNDQRVMGMLPFKGIASVVLIHDAKMLWTVPDEWTLEDAATVPVVYVTAIYALNIRARLARGESVLIHSAAGGVGQAALNICRSLDCTIFVTVGTDKKRDFVHREFGIPLEHIFSSRDTAFERKIKTLTKGRGVDVVLNSLVADKLQASVRCVAPNGRFLEIGKLDMQLNSSLGMFCFLNNITFHGVGIDSFFREGLGNGKLEEFMTQISHEMDQGISAGTVRPINRTVFEHSDAEKAFRYMASGQHIGKVLINMRPDKHNPLVVGDEIQQDTAQATILGERQVMRAQCKTWFSPDKVYIIAGGLGGVGLEMLYWMVLQGGRKFVLTSRSGVRTPFQRVFLSRFQVIEDFCSQYKIDIEIVCENIALEAGCSAVIDRALQMAPEIGGVFNLTLVLDDGLFVSKQTPNSFMRVCEPKCIGLANLDRELRTRHCHPDHFVAFSSFSAGRGNAGQTNYAYANSMMEKIIEQRNRDGLSGIAIQFGPIGDVGIVAEQFIRSKEATQESDSSESAPSGDSGDSSLSIEETIRHVFGLELQRINSCLEVVDRLLPLRTGVYSSYVKYVKVASTSGGDCEVIRQLCVYLNIDKRSDDDCLGDIGLDSLSAIEIQQRLENDFGISISLDDVRKITVKELKNFRDGDRHNLKQYSEDIKKARKSLSRVVFTIPLVDTILLNSSSAQGTPIYVLPPLKGLFDWVQSAVAKLDRPVIGLNWTRKTTKSCQTLKAVAEYYRSILDTLTSDRDKNEPCDLLVTAFGALIICLLAKKTGRFLRRLRTLIVLDLWPVELENMLDETKMSDYKVRLMFANIGNFMPPRICQQSLKEILALNCERERINKTAELMRKCVGTELRGEDLTEIVGNSYFRAELMLRYSFQQRRKSKRALRDLFTKVLATNDELTVHCIKLLPKTASPPVLTTPTKESFVGKKIEKVASIFDLDPEQIETEIGQRLCVHTIHGAQEEVTTGKLDSEIESILRAIVV